MEVHRRLEDPQDREAEQAVIGSLLIDAGRLEEVRSMIGPEDFADRRHAVILRAIVTLRERGCDIDIVSLEGILSADGQLENAGARAYLAELLIGVPSSTHAATYARAVKLAARKRAGLRLAERLAKATRSSNGNFDIELSTLVEEVRGLAGTADGVDWRLFSLGDALAPRPATSYLVDGLLPAPSLTIPYGRPGGLKTLWLLDLEACVVSGQPYLPGKPGSEWQPMPTAARPVLHVDFDLGHKIHDSIAAACRARGLEKDVPWHYASMPSPWLDASDPRHIDALIARARRYQAGLIGIDCLASIAGGVDENSSEMAAVMSGLRRLADEAEAAVVVLHHERKAQGFNARAGERLRGHSSIEAAVDLALLIEREGQADGISLRATKSRHQPVRPFGATFAYDWQPDTRELQTFRFFGYSILGNGEEDADITEAILQAVQDKPRLNGSQLVATVKETLPGVGHNRIRECANRLAAKGELHTLPGPRGSSLYG